ncbi:olfactory receptor 52H1-like [Mastacembelus armatus]|uniref:Olfactory receptor n=1 Tax=Mastacembelus armatus TaxID=205130 RepID=A0A3Q3LLN2_9TELE|nr:olfactory receptor 52H1-like [Mastacembelus armatus]
MYENSSSAVLLTLETLDVSNANIYPAFIFGTLTYLLIMFSNLLVLATIAVSKTLHKPMFILLVNLPISDMMGATAFFPHFLFSMVVENRQISYHACISQAFLIHVYGIGNFLILSAMAYDRYVAICCSLKYNTIMSPNNLIKINIFIWLINVSLVVTLFLLLVRFKICRTNIVDLYCNNPSLMKLVCEDISVNNYYGLVSTFLLQSVILFTIIYTYAQILCTCVMMKQSAVWKKAFQTCGTHLLVFFILQINALFTLMAHRFNSVSPLLRKALGVSILIFPPVLDPLIYGLKTTELRKSIMMFLKRNVGSIRM